VASDMRGGRRRTRAGRPPAPAQGQHGQRRPSWTTAPTRATAGGVPHGQQSGQLCSGRPAARGTGAARRATPRPAGSAPARDGRWRTAQAAARQAMLGPDSGDPARDSWRRAAQAAARLATLEPDGGALTRDDWWRMAQAVATLTDGARTGGTTASDARGEQWRPNAGQRRRLPFRMELATR
jgi:hypothetical protein